MGIVEHNNWLTLTTSYTKGSKDRLLILIDVELNSIFKIVFKNVKDCITSNFIPLNVPTEIDAYSVW